MMFLKCYGHIPVVLLLISILALMSNIAQIMFIKMQLVCI